MIAADGLAVADVVERSSLNYGDISIFIPRDTSAASRYLRDQDAFRDVPGELTRELPEDPGRELRDLPLHGDYARRAIRLEVTCPDSDHTFLVDIYRRTTAGTRNMGPHGNCF